MIQKFVIFILIVITSCGVQKGNVIIKNKTLREKIEALEIKGNRELSFYLRLNQNGSRILVIANYNLAKCEFYKSGGNYKSMMIHLFAESEEIMADCEHLFLFTQKSECILSDVDQNVVAPDSDMIYEYEITKSGLKAIGKW